MSQKLDPLKGMNPDQSGPLEKIQNGDPNAGPNRDQRSGAAEAGGPGESLQKGPTGTDAGQVPPHEGLVVSKHSDNPKADTGETDPAGDLDRAGNTSDEHMKTAFKGGQKEDVKETDKDDDKQSKKDAKSK